MKGWLLWLAIAFLGIANVGQESRINELERAIADADTARPTSDKGE